MSAEKFFQVCSAISSFIIFGCIVFMIIGIFRAPSLENITGFDDGDETGLEENIEDIGDIEGEIEGVNE